MVCFAFRSATFLPFIFCTDEWYPTYSYMHHAFSYLDAYISWFVRLLQLRQSLILSVCNSELSHGSVITRIVGLLEVALPICMKTSWTGLVCYQQCCPYCCHRRNSRCVTIVVAWIAHCPFVENSCVTSRLRQVWNFWRNLIHYSSIASC